MNINEEKAENTPAGGVLVGKKDGQTIIHDKGTMSGYLVGKLHKDGGIKAVNKATGQPLEMQGGEVVITAPAVSDQTKREFEGKMMTNREILSAINEKGGGVSFANGGDIPAKIHTTDCEYKFGGNVVKDTEIAHSLGMNSTLKKGKQHFSSGDTTYDVDAIYNAIKKGKLRLKTKEIETFPMKYPVYDKKYSETAKIDFRKPNGITVRTESGEDVLIDGNHRMNNAYLNGRKTMKTYYVEDPKQISKFSKKNKFIGGGRTIWSFDNPKEAIEYIDKDVVGKAVGIYTGGKFKEGGHLSKGKSLKQIAEMHNVSLAHINEELAKGLEVEKEHFADFKERTRVAKDHLVENPNYYTILAKAGLKDGGILKIPNVSHSDLKGKEFTFQKGKFLIVDFPNHQGAWKKNIGASWRKTAKHYTSVIKLDNIKTDLDSILWKKFQKPFFVFDDFFNQFENKPSFSLDGDYKKMTDFLNYELKNFKRGGKLEKEDLVKDAKSGNTPARDFNNYNDVMDLEADGAVGGDSGLAFADGGEINDKLWQSVKDKFSQVFWEEEEGDEIYANEVKAEERVWIFDRYSPYKSIVSWEDAKNMFLKSLTDEEKKIVNIEYNLREVSEAFGLMWEKKILVKRKKKLEEIDNLSDLLKFVEGDYAKGGITPYDANLDGDSADVAEDEFAKGGVVYDTTKPKIEKITIVSTGASISGRASVIGRYASTVSELQQIVSDYIGNTPQQSYDYVAFNINDNTRGKYYIELNKGKKNTVKNVNPETLNSLNFKRVIDNKTYLVKNYDWTDFFEGAGNKTVRKGKSVDGVNVVYFDTDGKTKIFQYVGNSIQLYNFLKKLYNDGGRYAELQPSGNGIVEYPKPIDINSRAWQNALFVEPEKQAIESIMNTLAFALFPKLDFSKFNNRYTPTASTVSNTVDLKNTKVWLGEDYKQNLDLIKKIQEKAFELGWGYGYKGADKEVKDIQAQAFYFDEYNVITYSSDISGRSFYELNNGKELTPEQILGVQTPTATIKKPVVVEIKIYTTEEKSGKRSVSDARSFEDFFRILKGLVENKVKYEDAINLSIFNDDNNVPKYLDLSFAVEEQTFDLLTDIEAKENLMDTLTSNKQDLDFKEFFNIKSVTSQSQTSDKEVEKVTLVYDTGTLRQIICNNGSELFDAYKSIEEQAEGGSLEVKVTLSGNYNNGQFFETQGISQEVGQGGFEPSQIYSFEEFEKTIKGLFSAFNFDNFFGGVTVPNSGSATSSQAPINTKTIVEKLYSANGNVFSDILEVRDYIVNSTGFMDKVFLGVNSVNSNDVFRVELKDQLSDYYFNKNMGVKLMISRLQDIFELNPAFQKYDWDKFFTINIMVESVVINYGKFNEFNASNVEIFLEEIKRIWKEGGRSEMEITIQPKNSKGSLDNTLYLKLDNVSNSIFTIEPDNISLSELKDLLLHFYNLGWNKFFEIPAPAIVSQNINFKLDPNEVGLVTLTYKDKNGTDVQTFSYKGSDFITELEKVETDGQGVGIEVDVTAYSTDDNGKTFSKNNDILVGGKGFGVIGKTPELIKMSVESFFRGLNFDKFFDSLVPFNINAPASNSAQPFDFFDTKIWIGDNPELSKRVQEKAFESGYKWGGLDRYVQNTERKDLYFNGTGKTINHGGDDRKDFDNATYFKEITEQDIFGSQTSVQMPTVSGTSGSVKEINNLKEAVGVLEGIASQASQKYNTKKYEESLELLKEVKEEYSLALSFTPESSFMYERIELMKKIAEIQKEITRITELKNGGAFYILSKVVDRLERGENWKELGNGEIMVNEVPQQEIDTVIYTEKFKNWFGDWEQALITKEYDYVSKAITKSGKPCVMYHGAKRIKYSYRQVSNGVVYLAENRSYAEWFSSTDSPYQKQGDYLTQCFVNLKNPIDLTPFGVEEVDLRDIIQYIDALYPLAKIYDVLPPNVSMAIMNNQLIGRNFRAWYIIRQFPELNKHIRDNTTYDGFIYYENNPSDIILSESGEMVENVTKATAVFNSNQVKLVDAMLFDGSLDDWRFETGGKVN
jgi:hypothetical protein